MNLSSTNPGAHLFIIANSLTPYRQHFHTRIARELPELRLHTILTHEEKERSWDLHPPEEIGVEQFGEGSSVAEQTKFTNIIHEWRKAGRIIEQIANHDTKTVIVLGYNDIGRLRIIRWCKKHGVSCFVWADSNICGDPSAGLRRVAKKLVIGWVLRSVTGVMVCGRLGKAFFERFGDVSGRTWLVPYEPDYSLFESISQMQIDEIMRRLGLSSNRRHLIFSGRLVEVKRVDLAIDAFVAIASKRAEWDLVIVGEGPLRAELEKRVPAELKDRVIWVGFLGSTEDIAALYRACDVLMLCSDYEPWALVINEAAAAGLAIVCSDVIGAAAELVREDVNGYTFPRSDLKALIECLDIVTEEVSIDRLKSGSRAVLTRWRLDADPVRGLEYAIWGIDPA